MSGEENLCCSPRATGKYSRQNACLNLFGSRLRHQMAKCGRVLRSSESITAMRASVQGGVTVFVGDVYALEKQKEQNPHLHNGAVGVCLVRDWTRYHQAAGVTTRKRDNGDRSRELDDTRSAKIDADSKWLSSAMSVRIRFRRIMGH